MLIGVLFSLSFVYLDTNARGIGRHRVTFNNPYGVTYYRVAPGHIGVKSLLDKDLIDCIAMDVKAPLEDDLYARLIGTTFDINELKESIEIIRNSGIEAIFRLTVVPNLLTEDDIYRVARDLAPVKKFILQQFSPEDALDPTLRRISPWPQEELDRIQQRVDEIIIGGSE